MILYRKYNIFSDTLSASTHHLLANIAIHVATDGCVTKEELLATSCIWTRPVILIVCLRLGAQKMNRCYQPHLRHLLSMSNSVGMIGGRPRHSLYFIGCYHRHLIYLDPHRLHKYVHVDDVNVSLKSYHCRHPEKLPMIEMDPSCAIGFFIDSEAQFRRTMSDLNQVDELFNNIQFIFIF
jgi:cysteine protease ATG4